MTPLVAAVWAWACIALPVLYLIGRRNDRYERLCKHYGAPPQHRMRLREAVICSAGWPVLLPLAVAVWAHCVETHEERLVEQHERRLRKRMQGREE